MLRISACFALIILAQTALSAEIPGPVEAGEKRVGKLKKTVPELIELVRGGSSREARGLEAWSIRDLGGSGDKRAVPVLISLVEKGDGEERRWAIDALAVLGDTEAVTVITRALEDPASFPDTAAAPSGTSAFERGPRRPEARARRPAEAGGEREAIRLGGKGHFRREDERRGEPGRTAGTGPVRESVFQGRTRETDRAQGDAVRRSRYQHGWRRTTSPRTGI